MKFLQSSTLFLLFLLSAFPGKGQNLFVPEGLNMPGTWNAYSNPPNKSMFRMSNPPGTSIEVPCGTDLAGGSINLFNNLYPAGQLATSLYRTSFSTSDAGGAGSYNFLLTSGPCSNFYQNKWSRSNIAFTGVNLSLNAVETYYFCNTIGSGNPAGCVDWGNTDIALSSGKYYTVNFLDNGYSNTTAIFFETSASPVTISTVTSAYDNSAGACNGGSGLIVTVTCSGVPSAEEKFYVRYSTSSAFTTSTFTPVVFADTTQLNVGKAVIPFSAGTTFYYYALSSTLSPTSIAAYSVSAQTDIVTLMAHTNSGTNYSYSFTTSSALNMLSGYYLIDNTAGTYFPNSFAFSSLANAVTALNTNGVCGNVVVQVKGDYSETAPSGGYVLKYSGGVAVSTAASTVTIRKMGSAGSHPLITAWSNIGGTTTAGSATTGDGIFKIVGADYITIEHIDLQENSLNTAAGPRMEYGYALLKESVTNGSQYCTITGCNITLNRLNNTSSGSTGNESGSTGIASLNITNTSSTTLATTGASSSGCNSNNLFSGNTISNVFNGIVIKGFNALSPYSLYDQKNKIGETGNGNVIENYGGSGALQAYGIYLIYQNLDSVISNTVDNLGGGGVVHTNILYGIFCSTATNASAYIGENTISVAKGSANNDLVAFRSSLSGTGKIELIDNMITDCSSSGGTGSFYGIYIAAGVSTQTITGNSIINNTAVNTTGSAFLFYTNNSGSTTINVSTNTIAQFSKTGAGNNIYGYYNATAGSGGSETISSNNFSTIAGTGSTNVYGIYSVVNFVSSQSAFITGNTINGLSTGGTATTQLMGIYYQKQSNSKNATISSNEVSNLDGAGEITGISGSVQCCNGTSTTTFDNNIVHDLTSMLGDVYGLETANSILKISANTIYGLTANSSKIARGIYITGFQNVDCYQNKIYDLIAYGTSGAVYGIFDDNTASDHNYYNNYVGNLEAPESSLTNAVSCLQSGVNMGPVLRIYNNTFYLNTSSSGTNFGSAAVLIPTNGFANTLFYFKNNIAVNLSAPNGTGISAALKVTETNLGQYMDESNNNLFYAGTPSSSKVLFHNGTNGYQDTTSFKTFVGPVRESNSLSAMPDFLEVTDGSSPDFLHIDPSGSNVDFVDEQALPIINEVGLYGTIINLTTDWDNDARDALTPDIGADEIVPVILPIQLAGFNVTLYEDDAFLAWNTASEYNSDYFSIERSLDGIHYIEIYVMEAAGFSIMPLDYSYADYQVKELGVNKIFYRLRMVDNDNSFEYSAVRWVDLNETNYSDGISIFPNPVNDEVTITFYSMDDQPAILQVIDISGRVIREIAYSLSKGVNFIEIDQPGDLAAGLYLVQVTSGRNFFTAKLVKE